MLKRAFTITILLAGCFLAALTAAAKENVLPEINNSIVLCIDSPKVYVKGKQGRIDDKNKEIAPFAEKGNTFVPLRFISEKLGGKLSWNAKTQEITISVNGDKAKMTVGEPSLSINGKKLAMNTASQTINGTTYLPLRHVVEDIFHQKLYYKNGIIIISDKTPVISKSTLSELELALKPKAVYSGGQELLYVFADGTSIKKKLQDVGDVPWGRISKVEDISDQHFYIAESDWGTNNLFIYKTDLNGNSSTIELDPSESMSLIAVQDGQQYYNAKNNIVKISEADSSKRQVLGKGYLMQENMIIEKDTIWFTDVLDEYTIFKLHKGKKTKLTGTDAFIRYSLGNWIYYGHYENKRWALYRMTKDGGSKTKLSGDADIGHSIIANNKIYYLDLHSKTVRVMNVDGSNKQVICQLKQSGVSILAVDKGFIYFTEDYQGRDAWTQTLYKANLSNGTKTRLVHGDLDYDDGWKRIKNLQVLGNYIYYSIYGDVFVMKSDGSGRKKIASLYSGYRNTVKSIKN
ncbi:DUF5050 domain-containing protein [Paenibacillaceae bacterium]|nr:DUF5050 domain-containing protein [Paenibacillaceae bacterium]